MKKFVLRMMAWLLAVAMILPSAGVAISAQAAETYKGSVTYKASGEWAEKELTMKELVGDVDPDDVTAIKFTSDVTFQAGYNATAGAWKWGDAGKSCTVTDIRFDDWFAFKFALTQNDNKEYTINWEVLTGDVAPVEDTSDADGEVFPVETIVNDSWGVYTNKIPVSTLEKYEDGMVIDIEFKVDNGATYALLSPVNAIANWPKLVDYITGVTFNSDDGSYIAFGPDANHVKMTLTEEGVEKVIEDEGGLIIQGFQLQFTKVTLSSAVPKETPTPTPTEAPTVSEEPVEERNYAVEGDELVITKDMVEDGIVAVTDAKYNSIVIPRDIDAATIRFADVKVGEIKVESGADYEISLLNADVDELKITAPVVTGISKEVLLEMIKEKTVLTEEMLLGFLAYTETVKEVAQLQPVIKASNNTDIDNVIVDGNVKLAVNGCNVAVNAKDAENALNVELVGFDGKVDVAVNSTGEKGFCFTNLTLTNSDAATVNVSGTEGSCYIGGNSELDKVQISGAGAVTVAVNAKEVVLDKNAKGAKVNLYGNVDTVTASGKENDVILAVAAKVNSAKVTGNDIRVYGYGKLEAAEITGKDANVAVYGTEVEGENNRSIPESMKRMNPWKVKESASKKEEAPAENSGTTTKPNEPIVIYEGSFAPGADEWSASELISAEKLSSMRFDGTQKLVITYQVTATSAVKLADMAHDYDTIVKAKLYAGETTREVIITSEWEGLVTGGIALQKGDPNAFTITKVTLEDIEGEYELSDNLIDTPVDCEDWGKAHISLDASVFSNLAFDGSEKLVITYTTLNYTDSEYTAIQCCDSSWAEIVQVGDVATFNHVLEIPLTEAFEAVATGGMKIQGHNWTITEVVIAE